MDVFLWARGWRRSPGAGVGERFASAATLGAAVGTRIAGDGRSFCSVRAGTAGISCLCAGILWNGRQLRPWCCARAGPRAIRADGCMGWALPPVGDRAGGGVGPSSSIWPRLPGESSAVPELAC